MCRDGIPPKICAAVIILALSSSGAKRKYFQTRAQGLLINVTLQFHSRGWITIPGFPSKKKWNSTGWFCPPPPSPSIGVGIAKRWTAKKHCETLLMVGGLSWAYVRPMLCWPTVAHLGGVGPSWRCGPILGPCWPILGPSQVGPSWGYVGPSCGLCWPMLPILGHKSRKMGHGQLRAPRAPGRIYALTRDSRPGAHVEVIRV